MFFIIGVETVIIKSYFLARVNGSALACCLLLCSLVTSVCFAKVYPLPAPNSRLIGEMQYHEVVKGDYFQQIAEKYDVGFLALMAANPGIDPFLPAIGQQLIIPSQMLLPYGKREGIVINLPELRLYYFPANSDKVHVFPVGIGRQGLATPKTVSYIGEKRKNPVWRPTAEMKQRHFVEYGTKLADEVPAGPNNPFGQYALRLGTSVYLLHGSNRRFGIGMRASSGCIRLYDDDIEWLYQHVEINTPVRIVDQAIKLSYEANKKLFEVHSPLTADDGRVSQPEISNAVSQFIGDSPDNMQLLLQQIASPKGLVTKLVND
ncbi:LysM peptidoglycan-binding domain-containing protein [Colwellia sp. M166]|uniref:L,D-transpeptidase family protein n=1 Tax=Colwellia sp. M166 TaxID=2583805 RepID=UPI00211E07F1|nr:L,D-transpeptidase family protein [Colwellia sp. M166]UUO22748.1 LysM peptidoglycan-binding domain-containing protein [Colwellia sp. M166]|tara:strand:+ start:14148 stop:15104 length:957 start_codon:yes stop_codon:yes gene_type:complete